MTECVHEFSLYAYIVVVVVPLIDLFILLKFPLLFGVILHFYGSIHLIQIHQVRGDPGLYKVGPCQKKKEEFGNLTEK